MITVQFNGRLGNRLTQYAFGRLLAERTEQGFRCPTIPEFPELAYSFSADGEHDPDRILLNGYFENSDLFVRSRKKIITWFNPLSFTCDWCAIHVRGGDAYVEGFRCPPYEYYEQAVKQMNMECRIITDDPANEIVAKLSERFGYKIIHTNPRGDFDSIRSAPAIIIGNSTFAWWAAFLSGHNNIIQPAPTHGWRSRQQPTSCLEMFEWTKISYAPNH